MRNSVKAILVLFVICLSLVAVQNNSALANETITGTVCSIAQGKSPKVSTPR
jgi:hypothetical protein